MRYIGPRLTDRGPLTPDLDGRVAFLADKEMPTRRERRPTQDHAGLIWSSVSLSAIASVTSGDTVIPARATTPAARDDMVDIELDRSGPAVLTAPSVARH